ncbi:DUF5990 family protein [Kitasatospora sp. NPDC018619]|uniref:DUF5990 family protein n=1 Tax=unclassified Kitasatospora TaxID=2633591 RepID=UPI0037B205E0
MRIEAFDLPGRTCGAAPGLPGYRDIHVAVQRRGRPDELLGLHARDAPSATWPPECTATSTDAGTDLTGPYVQGRPGARFVYLSWGTVDEAGAFTPVRRAKPMLDGIDPKALDAALRSGRLPTRLRLSDAGGRPPCARVRPPLAAWSAAP